MTRTLRIFRSNAVAMGEYCPFWRIVRRVMSKLEFSCEKHMKGMRLKVKDRSPFASFTRTGSVWFARESSCSLISRDWYRLNEWQWQWCGAVMAMSLDFGRVCSASLFCIVVRLAIWRKYPFGCPHDYSMPLFSGMSKINECATTSWINWWKLNVPLSFFLSFSVSLLLSFIICFFNAMVAGMFAALSTKVETFSWRKMGTSSWPRSRFWRMTIWKKNSPKINYKWYTISFSNMVILCVHLFKRLGHLLLLTRENNKYLV